jgi:hypothetical protein
MIRTPGSPEFSRVGCDQRAETESRCAGAEICERSWRLCILTVARAGTPHLKCRSAGHTLPEVTVSSDLEDLRVVPRIVRELHRIRVVGTVRSELGNFELPTGSD